MVLVSARDRRLAAAPPAEVASRQSTHATPSTTKPTHANASDDQALANCRTLPAPTASQKQAPGMQLAWRQLLQSTCAPDSAYAPATSAANASVGTISTATISTGTTRPPATWLRVRLPSACRRT